MHDTISRQDAIELAEKVNGNITWADRDELLKQLKALPSADRPKGEWIGDRCSICGEERAWYGNQPNFCPDCGADMR